MACASFLVCACFFIKNNEFEEQRKNVVLVENLLKSPNYLEKNLKKRLGASCLCLGNRKVSFTMNDGETYRFWYLANSVC